MQEFPVWLKEQFEADPSKTKIGLAAALGISPARITGMLDGTRALHANEIMTVARYFGKHPMEVLGEAPQVHYGPVEIDEELWTQCLGLTESVLTVLEKNDMPRENYARLALRVYTEAYAELTQGVENPLPNVNKTYVEETLKVAAHK